MRTEFSPAQLANPDIAEADKILRKCVHCGFCTATCPTYVVLGDELDSPRGRIYLMKEMLEQQAAPTAEVVKHIDRCLSCLSCMTTCPSGVNYMHLVDHARAYIEDRYRRPLRERLVRWLLAKVLTHPKRFRAALEWARRVKPLEPHLRGHALTKPFAAMLALAPSVRPPKPAGIAAGPDNPKGRVILLQGCAEPVLQPDIRPSAARLMIEAGYDVVLAKGEVCCGALVHHMGRKAEALDFARRNIDAWMAEVEGEGVDAIVITASGCGTSIKDYGFMLRGDPAYAEKAARVSGLAKDISEFLAGIELGPVVNPVGLRVAYHAACSLQHGQKITEAPKELLRRAGFEVVTPADAHLCCGSAGVYNILQPELAGAIGDRKVETLDRLGADVIATGNIGCATQIALKAKAPVVHVVQLLDWAHTGARPPSLTIKP
jgi:glycolate oxidase iron-sulfur subunit